VTDYINTHHQILTVLSFLCSPSNCVFIH